MTTAFAHGQIHGVNKKEPLYLTALDVVIRVKGLLDEEKLHLREHLIACRVHISDDWVDTYGTVEILKYNFGPRGTVRGEIDASFKEVVKADGSRIGQADISMIIWSGNQLVWAEAFKGIHCSNSSCAECLATLALLLKCLDLKLFEVQLCSNDHKVIHLITGEEPVDPADVNSLLYLLLKTIRIRFIRLDAVWKWRELMFLADQVVKGGFTIEKAL